MSDFRRLAFALWLPLFGLIGQPSDVSAQQRGAVPRAPAAQAEVPAPTPGSSRGENFSSKPAASLFATDCSGAGCHRGPQGLGREMSQGGLADFLREHYTNSRESAASLAAYLRSAPAGKPQMTPATPERAERPAPAPRARAVSRTDEPPKPGEEEGATPSPGAPKPPRRALRGETPPTPPGDILREEAPKEGVKEGAKEEGAPDGIKEGAKPDPRKPMPKPAPRGRQVTATPAPPVAAAAPEPPPPPPPPPPPKQYDIFD